MFVEIVAFLTGCVLVIVGLVVGIGAFSQASIGALAGAVPWLAGGVFFIGLARLLDLAGSILSALTKKAQPEEGAEKTTRPMR